ncbi:hypothetical protein WS45_05585 [Burkholderia sp. RF2-non_BP3]|nr:hypothetical protein WS45_05585 [Burkholderia sp. RF2-non_BP3]
MTTTPASRRRIPRNITRVSRSCSAKPSSSAIAAEPHVGAGANLQGEGTLRNGLIAMLLIVPVFLYRHYWQDRGRFPAQMQRDMELEVPKRAMWLNLMPYAALATAALTIAGAYHFAWGH